MTSLIAKVRASGAALSVAGDKLRIYKPEALDEALIEELRSRKLGVIAALCSVPDCGADGRRIELGGGQHTVLCGQHSAELHRRVADASGPGACKECSAAIPGSATLCSDCGAKHGRLVAFALSQGATQMPVDESHA